MTNKSMRRKVVANVSGFVLAATLAMAAWLVGGSGDVYTKAGEAQALSTVDISATVSADLFPSDTGEAFIRISNPNGAAVSITSIAQAGDAVDLDDAGCDLGDSVSLATAVDVGNVPAEGTADFTLDVSTSSAFPNCVQGHSISIPVTLTGSIGN